MPTAFAMNEADHIRVSAAVRVSEANTAGEIVTIVADHSDRYLDVALWWSVGAAIAALVALASFPEFYARVLGWFSNGWAVEASFTDGLRLALIVAAIKFAGVRLFLQWIPLRLWLTPGTVKSSRVRRRAIRYFKVGAERRTSGRTGILIYLSLREHRAEIVADAAIHSIVPNEVWGQAMADLMAQVRQGRLADGMIAAVNAVGVILAEHFPRADDDKNELPDRLIEL